MLILLVLSILLTYIIVSLSAGLLDGSIKPGMCVLRVMLCAEKTETGVKTLSKSLFPRHTEDKKSKLTHYVYWISI